MMDTLVSLSPYLLPFAFVAVSCLTTWSPQIKKSLPFPEFLEDTLKEVSELFMLDILKPEVLKQDLVVVDSTTHAHVESQGAPREIIQLFHMAKGYIIDLAYQLFMNVNTLVKSFTMVIFEMFYVSNNMSHIVASGAMNSGKLVRAEIMKIVREREKKMLEKNKETIGSHILDSTNENVEVMSEMEYLEFLEYVASCTSKDDTTVNDQKLGRTELMQMVHEKEKKMFENKEGELSRQIPNVTDENVEPMSKMEYMEYLDYVSSCNVANRSVTKGRKLGQVLELMESFTEKKRGMTGDGLSPRTLHMTDENVESMSKLEYSEFLEYVASCDFDNSVTKEVLMEKEKVMEKNMTIERELSSSMVQMADENVEFMSNNEYSEFLEYVVSCSSDKNVIKGANVLQFELMEARKEKQKEMIENRVSKGGPDAWSPTLQTIDENVEFMSEVEYLEYLEFVATCAI